MTEALPSKRTKPTPGKETVILHPAVKTGEGMGPAKHRLLFSLFSRYHLMYQFTRGGFFPKLDHCWLQEYAPCPERQPRSARVLHPLISSSKERDASRPRCCLPSPQSQFYVIGRFIVLRRSNDSYAKVGIKNNPTQQYLY